MMDKRNSIYIKLAETDEEICGKGYVHCTSWKEAYRGIICDQYLDSMTVEATTARARRFPENTLVAKDRERVIGFAVYGESRDEDLANAGEIEALYVLSEYYGCGAGFRLMNEAVTKLREYDTIFLWVLEEKGIQGEERVSFLWKEHMFSIDNEDEDYTIFEVCRP